jgi:predicted RNA-binding protein with RPS1 domain
VSAPPDEKKVTLSGAQKRKLRKEREKNRVKKPLSEFVVGQEYTGKVKAIHPEGKGIFIDIGGVRDGFCHVSRLRDEYVEDIHKEVKVGQTVKPRVIDIMPKRNKITLSLQSEKLKDRELEAMSRFKSGEESSTYKKSRSSDKQAARNARRLEKKQPDAKGEAKPGE